MSTFLRPPESVYAFNRKEDETLCKQGDGIFKFKYVPVHHFKRIVKKVQRNRVRKEEEYVWATFVKHNSLPDKDNTTARLKDDNMESNTSQGEDAAYPLLQCNSRGSCSKSTSKIDTELTRLEEDTLPEKDREVRSCGVRNSELASPNKEKSLPLMANKDILPGCEVEKRLSNDKKTCAECNQDLCTKNVDGDSSLRTSTDCNTFKGVIYTRPNPQATYKILTMQRRVVGLLDEISSRLSQIPSPDSDNDLKRRQQRVTEFAVRFSRNYLYNLSRCVADAQRHAYTVLSNANMTRNKRLLALHMRAAEQKLIDAYQWLLHALIAYCKHIPSSVVRGSPGKLENVLQVVTALQNICEETRMNTTYFGAGDDDATSVGKDMLDRCTEILCKLRTKSENGSPTANSACPLATRNKKRGSSRNNNIDRYSMYAKRNRPKCQWKSKVDVRRTRKPIVMNSPVEEKDGKLSTDGPSEVVTRNGAIRAKELENEDDIKTMMGMLPIDSDERTLVESRPYTSTSAGGNANSTQKNTCYNKCVRNLKISGCLSSAAKNGEHLKSKENLAATDKDLASLVPVVADLMSLMKGEYESARKPAPSVPLKPVIGVAQQHKSLRRTSVNSSTSRDADVSYGETAMCNNNARLVCLTSDRGVLSVPQYCEVSCQTNNEEKNAVAAAFDSVEERRHEETPAATNPVIRLSVTEKTRVRIADYRMKYQRYIELKSMYASNTQNKPWEIVAWISDKLVDELIVEIAKELEMVEVIEKLLDLEFREC